jgi:hypothetical protein
MAAFQKFNAFIDQLTKGAHNLTTASYRVALTNTAPAATDTVWSSAAYPPPVSAFGYPAGGNTPAVTSSATVAGTFKLILVDSVFAASGGQIGPFRYVILYNFSSSNNLIGYYDYGSLVTLNDGETFTVDFDGLNGVFTLA